MTKVRINNNSKFVTGYSATEAPTKGFNNGTSTAGNRISGATPGVDGTYTINYLNTSSVVSSTTGNYSGIYDMSGGASDVVAAYTTSCSTIGANSEITKLYSDFFDNILYENYWDKYSTSSTGYTDYKNRILGDATGELGPFYTATDPDGEERWKASWYKEHSYFIANKVSRCWFARGNAYNSGVASNVLSFAPNTGESGDSTFRIVLTPTK